jgi:hypothetical protein
MVAGVFTKVLCSIVEVALVCFTKNRIEWFGLSAAHIYTTHGEGNYVLQTLKRVVSISCSTKIIGSEGPEIAHSTYRWFWFKDLSRHRNVRNAKSFPEVDCNLLNYFTHHTILFIKHFLIGAYQASIIFLLKPFQNSFELCRQLKVLYELESVEIYWWRCCLLIFLPVVNKWSNANRDGMRLDECIILQLSFIWCIHGHACASYGRPLRWHLLFDLLTYLALVFLNLT